MQLGECLKQQWSALTARDFECAEPMNVSEEVTTHTALVDPDSGLTGSQKFEKFLAFSKDKSKSGTCERGYLVVRETGGPILRVLCSLGCILKLGGFHNTG